MNESTTQAPPACDTAHRRSCAYPPIPRARHQRQRDAENGADPDEVGQHVKRHQGFEEGAHVRAG